MSCDHQQTTNRWHAGDQGKSVDVYFPQGKWYDWYTHQVVSANGGETKTIDTPIDMIPVCCTRVLLESTDEDIDYPSLSTDPPSWWHSYPDAETWQYHYRESEE